MKNIFSCTYSLDKLDKLAQELLKFAGDCKFWLLDGDLGAGKTTLIKVICSNLDVTSNVSSATYSIINEYVDINNKSIYHCDFYRISHLREAIDIGFEEILYGDNYCFIEWPSKIEDLLFGRYLVIKISYVSDNIRSITAEIMNKTGKYYCIAKL